MRFNIEYIMQEFCKENHNEKNNLYNFDDLYAYFAFFGL